MGPLELGARLSRWASLEPDQRYPRYLLGRQLLHQGRFAAAGAEFRAALEPNLAAWSPRFQREAARQWLLAECATLPGHPHDLKTPKELWSASPEGLAAAEKLAFDRTLALCQEMHSENPASTP